MFWSRSDGKELREGGAWEMVREYEKKFGERFLEFNYVDFKGTKEKSAAQVYLEALREALAKNEPTRIESHRFDIIDH